eukprot:TRINITY_DN6352_c0_g1_i1.p1 TRINITY_DN6352_c0_g1~~TRINITY_DN6352_c0_g1_i1.p1  ORF type:complete len:315 (-),score=80.81 TRINITY_DN6352_c0_g1_i1:307-1251(-)
MERIEEKDQKNKRPKIEIKSIKTNSTNVIPKDIKIEESNGDIKKNRIIYKKEELGGNEIPENNEMPKIDLVHLMHNTDMNSKNMRVENINTRSENILSSELQFMSCMSPFKSIIENNFGIIGQEKSNMKNQMEDDPTNNKIFNNIFNNNFTSISNNDMVMNIQNCYEHQDRFIENNHPINHPNNNNNQELITKLMKENEELRNKIDRMDEEIQLRYDTKFYRYKFLFPTIPKVFMPFLEFKNDAMYFALSWMNPNNNNIKLPSSQHFDPNNMLFEDISDTFAFSIGYSPSAIIKRNHKEFSVSYTQPQLSNKLH